MTKELNSQRKRRNVTVVDVADMECLSIETASRVYDVPESTLRGYAREGKIEGAHRKGKRWILPKEGLTACFKGVSAS